MGGLCSCSLCSCSLRSCSLRSAQDCVDVSHFLTERGVHPDTVKALCVARVDGKDLHLMFLEACSENYESWTRVGVTDDARIQEAFEACVIVRMLFFYILAGDGVWRLIALLRCDV